MHHLLNTDPLVWFAGAHAFLAGIITGWLLQTRSKRRLRKEIRELKQALQDEIERGFQLSNK